MHALFLKDSGFFFSRQMIGMDIGDGGLKKKMAENQQEWILIS